MTFEIRRGVNMWGWKDMGGDYVLDQDRWFTEKDLARCAAIGLDHVRLPLVESILWDARGCRIAGAWDVVGSFLDWARNAGLRAIVELHVLRTHHFNIPGRRTLFTDPGEPDRFAGLWRELSAEFRARPADTVAYELMNEPVADNDDDWNRVYKPAYHALREREPDRTLILGSNRWNQVRTYPNLDIPKNDPNLMLTFHYYDPMQVTHYRAPFVTGCREYEGPIRYPGVPIAKEDLARLDAKPDAREKAVEYNRYADASVMEQDIQPVIAAGERAGCPVHCGEFGVIEFAPPEIRRAWIRDFRSVLERHNIPWTVWSYRGGYFGMFDASSAPTAVYEGLLT
ncbi:MAG: cellulase family glycosylhydrolase [Chitinivibrionales bacterium]|nr:cellulase family glycosylhydrolase [Chitinivibrionales bacterium]MBD3395470.1 cellulase family glycosylhydrolase [Chitinivibrionales bacterium]